MDGESDPNKTTCEACNITFSRTKPTWSTNSIIVRHAPRPSASRGRLFQQSACHAENHAHTQTQEDVRDVPAWTGSKAPASPAALDVANLSNPCTSTQEATEGLGECYHPRCDLFPGIVSKHLETSCHEQMCPVSKCDTAYSSVSCLEMDVPSISAKSVYPSLERTHRSPKGCWTTTSAPCARSASTRWKLPGPQAKISARSPRISGTTWPADSKVFPNPESERSSPMSAMKEAS